MFPLTNQLKPKYKITALAIRTEVVTPLLIHPDQTGLSKIRHAFDSMQGLFNLIVKKVTNFLL